MRTLAITMAELGLTCIGLGFTIPGVALECPVVMGVTVEAPVPGGGEKLFTRDDRSGATTALMSSSKWNC